MSAKDTAKALIPEYYDLKINSIEDLLFLGKENINAIAKKKEDALDEINCEIETLESYIELLSGETGDLKEIAKKYECVKVPPESLIESKEESGIMEPTRKEDKERKMGTTTLNNCSWCDYLGRATMKYECGLEGKCDLLEKAKPSSCDRDILSEGCIITKLDSDGIECLVSGYKSNIKKEEKQAEKIRRQIKKLNALSEKAEDKPYLPALRPSEYFNEGDEIMAYAIKRKRTTRKISSKLKSEIDRMTLISILTEEKNPEFTKALQDEIQNKLAEPPQEGNAIFIEAIVINGYRSQDGLVNFQEKGTKRKANQGFAGAERADAILKKDYEYLKANPDFAEAYFLNSEKAYLEGFKEIVMGK